MDISGIIGGGGNNKAGEVEDVLGTISGGVLLYGTYFSGTYIFRQISVKSNHACSNSS
jgi:hypothetical protein